MAGTGESFSLDAQVDVRFDAPSYLLLVATAICVIAFIAEISREGSLVRKRFRELQALWLKFESGAGGARVPGRAMSETTERGRNETQESEVGARRPATAPADDV